MENDTSLKDRDPLADPRLPLLKASLRKMYEVISFSEGEEPDWEGMRALFLPNAHVTRLTPEGVDYFDVPSFQAMAMEMLDMGVYTSFHEQEVAGRIEMFGALAHVLSVYETRRSPEAVGFLARGVNSLQWLWDGQRWRILSLFWEEETLHHPLDIQKILSSEVTYG